MEIIIRGTHLKKRIVLIRVPENEDVTTNFFANFNPSVELITDDSGNVVMSNKEYEYWLRLTRMQYDIWYAEAFNNQLTNTRVKNELKGARVLGDSAATIINRHRIIDRLCNGVITVDNLISVVKSGFRINKNVHVVEWYDIKGIEKLTLQINASN